MNLPELTEQSLFLLRRILEQAHSRIPHEDPLGHSSFVTGLVKLSREGDILAGFRAAASYRVQTTECTNCFVEIFADVRNHYICNRPRHVTDAS